MPEPNAQSKHKRQDSGLTFALQALLDRHEAYVKESQAEQARLSNHVSDLEHEKATLQDANHKIVAENRELLQRLEQLNSDFSGSDRRVHELENLLQDCEQEIRRLNGLTRKTQELEFKVLDLERDGVELNKRLEEEKLETRGTIARWKESERKVRELEHEIQNIEFEAKLDRERHEEIVARMEKERTLERELGLSEGRLKATAAVQDMKTGGAQGKQVVSNFVRDILQDNANLQAAIAEMRELLQSSNSEVQNLREQVMLHQPVHDDETLTQQRTQSLGEELGFSQSLTKPVQQEVHVHHHYHTKAGSKKERGAPLRRATRRRALLPSAALSSSPSSSGTSTPSTRPHRHVSGPAGSLSIQIHNPTPNRWSMQSNTTTSTYLSSMASSPRSYFDRNSSIFDRIETEEEISRPTSPESLAISSPMPFRRREKRVDHALSVFEEESPGTDEHVPAVESANSAQVSAPEAPNHAHSEAEHNDEEIPDLDLTPRPSTKGDSQLPPTMSVAQTAEPQAPDPPQPPDFLVRSEDDPPSHAETRTDEETASDNHTQVSPDLNNDPNALDTSNDNDNPIPSYISEIRPSIRRSNSHDSLVSISGMDIHLAQRPTHSALILLHTTGANKHHFAASPALTRKVSATQPLAALTEYTATSRSGLDNQPSASMLALNGIARNNIGQSQQGGRGLIGSVGGWVSRKWGVVPTKSAGDARPAATLAATPTLMRPAMTHIATSPLIKSSASILSHHSAATTSTNSTITSKTSGKRSVSANALNVSRMSISSSTISADKQPASLLGTSLGANTVMRMPGINQAGPIPGFAAAVAARIAPTEIEAREVDLSGLKESLDDH